MLSPDLFRDNTVIAKAGKHEVLRESLSVPLGLNGVNAGVVGVHIVRLNGHEAMYLRAVAHDDARLIVFDLRDVHDDFEKISATAAIDVPGLILYTLRQAFASRAEALAAMMRNPLDVLTIDPVAAHAPEVATA